MSLIMLILSNSVTLRRDKSILFNRSVIISLLYSSFLAFNSYYLLFLGNGIGLYGGLFFISSITHTFHIIIYILTSIILIFTGFYPSYGGKLFSTSFMSKKASSNLNVATELNINKETVKNEDSNVLSIRAEMYKIIEYPLIILFIVNGALFLICTSDLISLFISIELQSYGLYLLSTIYKDSELATSGGLMYFLLGGLSSCFILLGAGLLYANSGTTNIDNLYIINDISNVCSENSTIYNSYYIIISLIFMSVGFLFKVSAAPFHFWSPDVYDSIPTIVTTFVAIIAKISIFIFLLEIVHHLSKSNFNYIWTSNLLISSLLSLIIGTVLGLSQSRIKRLFAYSTISHLGFILLGLSINTVESIQAFMFYIIQYSFSNLNAFLLLVCIGYTYHYYVNKEYENLKDKANSPIQLINQLKGYFYINPILCLSLCITLFSFTGIPPLVGFFGKMMILSAAIDNGYIFMSLLAILTSVISAGYYLYIIKQMFFHKTDYIKNVNVKSPNYEIKIEQDKNIIISNYLTISISILTLFILLFMLSPSECLNITCILVLTLF